MDNEDWILDARLVVYGYGVCKLYYITRIFEKKFEYTL